MLFGEVKGEDLNPKQTGPKGTQSPTTETRCWRIWRNSGYIAVDTWNSVDLIFWAATLCLGLSDVRIGLRALVNRLYR